MKRSKQLRLALVLVCLASAALASSALAAYRFHLKEFSLAPGATRTVSIVYPEALKYAGAKYSGKVQIILPSASQGSGAPKRALVHILRQGSTLGGSEFTVRVRNANAANTVPVRIIVRVTTVW
jgi:hypothetical protein